MKQTDVGSTIIAGSMIFLVGFTLYAAGGPLKTPDAWFHLKMGEVYVADGLWPDADPLLHTAHSDAPVQHEWLFGVVLHKLHQVAGFHGLRVIHTLAIAGIVLLAWSIFYRECESDVVACWATCLFIVLSWWRLWQLRPDLVSIPAALLLYRILLERDRPVTWGRVGAAAALLLVWANFHSLFAVGLGILAAALGARAVTGLLERDAGPAEPRADAAPGDRPPKMSRLAAALGIGLLVTLVNPRGVYQHLTFVTSSRHSAIWSVTDEWKHHNPLAWTPGDHAVSLTAWLTMQLLLLAFLIVAGLGLVRLARRRSGAPRQPVEPASFGVALVSVVAILVSVRFMWMSLFVVLYLMRAWRQHTSATVTTPYRWGFACTALLLALTFPVSGSFQIVAERIPADFSEYLSKPYATKGLHEQALDFLVETRAEGNLYNEYALGGFFGYRLSPAIRTFVDGRTEHYPAEVLHDYFRIWRPSPPGSGESMLQILDRRGVDLFFGVGLPVVGQKYCTTAHLERTPGWILVYRTLDNAIYLRATEGDGDNVDRITSYYADLGIPFDPATGIDPFQVIQARLDWAAAQGMIPPDHAATVTARTSIDRNAHLRALDQLGSTYALLGAYPQLIEVETEAHGLGQRGKLSQRRLIYGLLRLGRAEEAVDVARALVDLDPRDGHSRAFLRAAEHRASQTSLLNEDQAVPTPFVDTPPLFTREEFAHCCTNYP